MKTMEVIMFFTFSKIENLGRSFLTRDTEKSHNLGNLCVKKFLVLAVIVSINVFFVGCRTFEATLATNVDIESNTYEMAMGYNKEHAFNLLVFSNIGFLMEDPGDSLVATLGLEYERWLNRRAGLSGRLGYREKYFESTEHTDYGLILQLGVPIFWSYGKITPYIGAAFYYHDSPKFNVGISLAARNQAVAIAFLALGAASYGMNDNISEHNKRKNMENTSGAVTGIMGMEVEAKLPYPAWKWRPQYEGIHWEYVGGQKVEIVDEKKVEIPD